MKKLAMKMLSLLLVLSLLLPTCVFAQPGQDEDGTPGTQRTTSEETTTFTEGGNGGGNGDETTKDENGGGNGDGDADTHTGGGNSDGTSKDENGDGNADTPEEPIVATVSIAVAAEDDGISQEELLEGYLYSISGLYGEGAAVFRAPSKPLSPIADAAYTQIAAGIPNVANGTTTSTKFTVTGAWTISRTDLGLGAGEAIFDGISLTPAASTKIWEYIDTDALLHRLLSTKPYELYWFDKTVGIYAGLSYDKVSDDEIKINSLTVYFAVSEHYHDSVTVLTDSLGNEITNGSGKKYYIATNDTKTKATKTAVDNAIAIRDANSGKSDYEKLKAYLEKICELVSYNDAATTWAMP